MYVNNQSMSKNSYLELILISIFILLTIIQLQNFNVSIVLYLSLLTLNIFWAFKIRNVFLLPNNQTDSVLFIQNINITDAEIYKTKSFNNKPYKILNLFFLSFFLWSLVFNITHVHHTTPYIVISLVLMSFIYFFNGLIYLFKNKKSVIEHIEEILGGIVFLGLAFRILHWPGGVDLLVYGLILLSILMFINGLICLSIAIKSKKTLFGLILLIFYIGLSGIIIFILLDSMFWSNANSLFLPNFFLIVFCVFYIYFVHSKSLDKNDDFFDLNFKLTNPVLKRSVVYISIALLFYFSTMFNYYQLEYGDRKSLIDLRIKCQQERYKKDGLKNCLFENELFKKYEDGKYPEGE